MTRCTEFYERWQKTPNWCEKTAGAVSQINTYLEFVEFLEVEHHIPREFTFVNLPEFTARQLLSIKDDSRREATVSRVIKELSTGAAKAVAKRGGPSRTRKGIAQIIKAERKAELDARTLDDLKGTGWKIEISETPPKPEKPQSPVYTGESERPEPDITPDPLGVLHGFSGLIKDARTLINSIEQIDAEAEEIKRSCWQYVTELKELCEVAMARKVE